MTWRNQWRENGAGGPRKVLGERPSLSVEGRVSATGWGRRICDRRLNARRPTVQASRDALRYVRYPIYSTRAIPRTRALRL